MVERPGKERREEEDEGQFESKRLREVVSDKMRGFEDVGLGRSQVKSSCFPERETT